MAEDTLTGQTADDYLYKESAVSWADCLAQTPSTGVSATTLVCNREYDDTSGDLWVVSRAFFSADLSGLAFTPKRGYWTLKEIPAQTGQVRLYYQDWGVAVAAGDWVDVSTLTAASDWITPGAPTAVIPLINIGSLAASNGRFVMVAQNETTEPTGADVYLECSSADDEGNEPTLYLSDTYTATGTVTLPALGTEGDGNSRFGATGTATLPALAALTHTGWENPWFIPAPRSQSRVKGGLATFKSTLIGR